jgi:hypothetical protein
MSAVAICGTSDSASKPEVGLALRRLANFLRKHGAFVYVIQLPDAPDGAKQGAVDYIVSCGVEAFTELVDDAEAHGSLAMVRRLQAEIRELRAQLSAEAALRSSPHLAARDKLVATAVIHEAGWRESTGAPPLHRQLPASGRVSRRQHRRRNAKPQSVLGRGPPVLGSVLSPGEAGDVRMRRSPHCHPGRSGW